MPVIDITNLPMLVEEGGYHRWKEAIQSYLRVQGLWRIVAGTITRPPPMAEATTAAEAEVIEENEKRQSEWDDLDERAHGVICLTLEAWIRHEVIDLPTSKAVWDALEEKYYVSTPSSF